MKKKATPSSLTLYFDGKCHLCQKKMSFFASHDSKKCITTIDITSKEFTIKETPFTQQELLQKIRGKTASNEWLSGIDAIHHAYRIIGKDRITRPSQWIFTRHLYKFIYWLMAKFRHRSKQNCDKNCSPY